MYNQSSRNVSDVIEQYGWIIPLQPDVTFIVFNISFSSAIKLLFRDAFLLQEQPADPSLQNYHY